MRKFGILVWLLTHPSAHPPASLLSFCPRIPSRWLDDTTITYCMEQMSLYLWIKPMRQWMKVAELG